MKLREILQDVKQEVQVFQRGERNKKHWFCTNEAVYLRPKLLETQVLSSNLETRSIQHYYKEIPMSLLLVIGLWACCGFACASIVKGKNRNEQTWFFLGVLLGIFAVAIVSVLPALG